MNRFSAWLLAARPKTLLASVSPVAIGTAMAWCDQVMFVPAALAAAIGAIAIQIGTNFCNDYYDFRQGADTRDRKGPTRAVQAGWISPRAMLAATTLMFAIAAASSLYLVLRAGWPLAVVGSVSIACGVWYTAGRNSLAYLGLADLFVLAFFGPVAVGGTYYVQALQLPARVLVAGLAPGLFSVGLLVVNNLRDVDEDRRAGKRTLTVRLGVTFSRWQYAACVLAACSVPAVLWQLDAVTVAGLLPCLTIVPATAVIRRVWTSQGRALNPCLGMTAGLLLLHTLLFCAGVSWH
jgi:1,4-dihydroxy-2-naphthoate octaprenyltransferase